MNNQTSTPQQQTAIKKVGGFNQTPPKDTETSNKRNVVITVSGRTIDIFNPRRTEIKVEDLVHSLSMQCRFNGHLEKFYSVAQHSHIVAEHIEEKGHDKETIFIGLIHDLTEGIIGDVIRPVKDKLPSFCEMEDKIGEALFDEMGWPWPSHEQAKIVKETDNLAAFTEIRDLGHSNGLYRIEGMPTMSKKIIPCSPKEARLMFLKKYDELAKEILKPKKLKKSKKLVINKELEPQF